jgi:3',5'-cyclic AMP phosphodiesterase CpdA
MKLAHVSDLHLMPDVSGGGGQNPSSMDVAGAIAEDLSAIAEGLDLVVVSGDLTERADAESFTKFEQIFERIGLPIILVPGNHDGPAGMLDYIVSSPRLADWHLTDRLVEIGGVRFLGLNTCIEGLTQGALDDKALSLVDEQIRRECDQRLVLVMHHPPLALGLQQFDELAEIERGDEFLRILDESAKELIVLSGHVHRPYSVKNGQISCFVAGSMFAPYDSLHPFGADRIRPAELQDFYYVHDIEPCGRHVVTPQRVRGLIANDGPQPNRIPT